MSLNGKTVLVTGASSGIGQAVAIECSKLGADVIITGRNEERLANTMDTMEAGNHRMLLADLTSETDIADLVSQLPKLDGVAHIAGMGCTKMAAYLKPKTIHQLLQCNLESPMLLQAELLKNKRINKQASIVFMASVAGIGGWPGTGLYSASKAGLMAYARCLTTELGAKGIRVNCILPGMVETPLIHGGAFDRETYEADKKDYPLGRYGKPDEVAHLTAFLLSDAAAWISGGNYVIDGGLSRH